MEKNFKELLKQVTTFVFDVDGVFTDGSVLLMPNGEAIRNANIKDGYATQLAVKKGYNLCIITGGTSEGVRQRFQNLGVKDIYMGAGTKAEVLEEYLELYDLKPENVLYMGDDIPDYENLKTVAVPTCPNDASQDIKDICIYISPINGGKGCVRDVIEQVMRVQGKWMDGEAFHW